MQPLIDVVQQTPNQLVVAERSEAIFGWSLIFLAGALIFLASGILYFFITQKGMFSRVLFLVIFCIGGLGFLFVWTIYAGSSYQATFLRDSGMVQMQSFFFGSPGQTREVALNQIRYADLESSRAGAKRLVLITKSGDVVVALAPAFSQKDGYYRVRDAINDFLHVSRSDTGSPGSNR